MSYLGVYLTAVLVTFIICSIMALVEYDHLGDVMIIAVFNVAYLMFVLLYKALRAAAVRRATKLLGKTPRTMGDARRLGIKPDENLYSVKNLLKILFVTKEVKE